MTLKDKIENTKKWYLEKYGKLDWKYHDEGLVYAIEDYYGSYGEITPEDWEYAKEEDICEEVAFIESEYERENENEY